jgi:hypothetical protein
VLEKSYDLPEDYDESIENRVVKTKIEIVDNKADQLEEKLL